MRTRLQIPSCGTEIRLSEDWTFPLYHESRNRGLATACDITWSGSLWCSDYVDAANRDFRLKQTEITLPGGTQLTVDRVYIRRASKPGSGGMNEGGEYNSITFRIVFCSQNPKLKGKRFWAKLADVNQIECEIADETLMGGRGVNERTSQAVESSSIG